MRRSPGVLVMLAALACGVAAAQQAQRLTQFTVISTGPAQISLPLADAPNNPMLRDAEGAWRPLAVEYADGQATLRIPTDAGGRAVILLDKPEWLALEDQTPPAVIGVAVDGADVEPAEGVVKLGHQGAPPEVVEVTCADGENPLDLGSLLATLNGVPLSADAGQVEVAKGDEAGRSATVTIRPGELAEDDYSLELRITDASVDRWPVKLEVTFSTAPLLANGSFEEGETGKCPARWSCGDWGHDAETKYEIARADGGRTGEHCLMLHGTAGKLNVIVHQSVDLIEGRTYLLQGYHRGAAGGYASMITRAGGKDVQYLNMPRLPEAEEWTPFKWEFTVEAHDSAMIVLRTTANGQIYFDDVSLAPQP